MGINPLAPSLTVIDPETGQGCARRRSSRREVYLSQCDDASSATGASSRALPSRPQAGQLPRRRPARDVRSASFLCPLCFITAPRLICDTKSCPVHPPLCPRSLWKPTPGMWFTTQPHEVPASPPARSRPARGPGGCLLLLRSTAAVAPRQRTQKRHPATRRRSSTPSSPRTRSTRPPRRRRAIVLAANAAPAAAASPLLSSRDARLPSVPPPTPPTLPRGRRRRRRDLLRLTRRRRARPLPACRTSSGSQRRSAPLGLPRRALLPRRCPAHASSPPRSSSGSRGDRWDGAPPRPGACCVAPQVKTFFQNFRMRCVEVGGN